MPRKALGGGFDLLPPRSRPEEGAGAAEPPEGIEDRPAEPEKDSAPPARRTARRKRSKERRRAEPPGAEAEGGRQGAQPQATGGLTRSRISVDVAADVAEVARDAVYWTPGLTLAALAETALLAEVGRREEERGEPFPPRSGELPPGPPVK